MAKFLKGSKLRAKIEKLFLEADEKLIIISPFIKLHPLLKDALKEKLDNHKLEVEVVYGKNETNKSRSLSKEDFDFFSQFSNIKIYYEPRLHAKYYANEFDGILSSMNLIDYSHDNNIEFGIEYNQTNFLEGSIGDDAEVYFKGVIERSTLEYHKKPVFESTLLGLSKKYVRSDIKTDQISGSLSKATKDRLSKPKDGDKSEKNLKTSKSSVGYCIRTGREIAFDIQIPYSDKAFKSWEQFGDADYPEKYCHFSGEASKGKTSMNKPVLSKYWSKAKLKK